VKFVRECCVAEKHPSLEGHFPGDPVVPGVVLLDLVLQAVKSWQPGCSISGFPVIKFLQPVLPGERFAIELEQTAPDRIRFSCCSDDRLLNAGSIALRPTREFM